MSQRTSPEVRELFYRIHRQGTTYQAIADQFGVSKECVRYWCRRQRAGQSCQTHFSRGARGPLSRFDPKVRFALLRLRLKHPRWGPGNLRVGLAKRPALLDLALPSPASIGRYLSQWKRFRRKPLRRRPPERLDQPVHVHQRWQMDFQVDIRLSDGTNASLYTVQDPVGEVCIGADLYPVRRGKRVHLERVLESLRKCFARWQTLPEEIQTDGETVLVGSNQAAFPTRFQLWLVGLGIRHLVIHRATQNAEVERRHRTIDDYALAGNLDQPFDRLQTIVDQAVWEMAAELPSRAAGCAGRPPLQAHPDLLQPRRFFLPEQELAEFDLKRMDRYLAHLSWTRKVDRQQRVYLGGRHERYKVGQARPGQTVLVTFDPADRQFVFTDLEIPEKELGRQPARGLDVADITGRAGWPIGPGPQQLRLPLVLSEGVSC